MAPTAKTDDGQPSEAAVKEPSLSGTLRNILADEELCDVSLQGTDGSHVRANRYVLAARSKIFRKMLFGGFREASNSTISLGYKGDVLEAIVEYIHTDEAKILAKTPTEWTSSNIRTLVTLAGAAMYFELPGLGDKSQEVISRAMVQEPSISAVVLSVCHEEGPSIPKRLEALAYLCLQSLDVTQCDSSRIQNIKAPLLEEILNDATSQLGEFELFSLLSLWTENSSSNGCKERLAVASRLSRHIRLELIEPSKLATVVAPSGLVSQGQLMEAYKSQALVAQEQQKISFEKPRFALPFWEDSGTPTSTSQGDRRGVVLLNSPPMVSGALYRWTIKVEEHCVWVWLGVASTKKALEKDQWLGKQSSGWVYGSNGSSCHATGRDSGPYNNIHPSFGKNDHVTLTLDLRSDTDGHGILSASVNGKNTFKLFSGMLGESDRFVPAVSNKSPGRVRLLTFEKLETGVD